MPECDECGSELVDPIDKNASGWWRDYCLACIGAKAPDDRDGLDEQAYQEWLDTHE
jgi:hypothetical protein